MTDEQWLWVYANMLIDNEDRLNQMCPTCRNNVTSDDKCTACGKTISNVEYTHNPKFDADRFNRLLHDSDVPTVNTNFNMEAYNRCKDGE